MFENIVDPLALPSEENIDYQNVENRKDWYYMPIAKDIRKNYKEGSDFSKLFESLQEVLPPNHWSGSYEQLMAWRAIVSLNDVKLIGKAIDLGMCPNAGTQEDNFHWFSETWFRDTTLKTWLSPPQPSDIVKGILLIEKEAPDLLTELHQEKLKEWRNSLEEQSNIADKIVERWPGLISLALKSMAQNYLPDKFYQNPLIYLIKEDVYAEKALIRFLGKNNENVAFYEDVMGQSPLAMLELGLMRRNSVLMDAYWMKEKTMDLDALYLNRYGMSQTLLHSAVRRNDVWLVDFLVENGASIEAQNDMGQTPIFVAASLGNLDLMKKFKALGADVHTQDRYGQTLVHAACVSSRIFKYDRHQNTEIQVSDTDINSILDRTTHLLTWLKETGISSDIVATPFKRTAKNKNEIDPFEYLGPAPRRKKYFAAPKEGLEAHLNKLFKNYIPRDGKGGLTDLLKRYPQECYLNLNLKTKIIPDVELQGGEVVEIPVMPKRQRF